MRFTLIMAWLAILLSGCAVQKTLVPTGGSRADGTIEMSYEYGMFETPKVDFTQGARDAAARCAAWGYADAEPFGGSKQTCQVSDMYGGCSRWLVTVQYQCIGAKTPQ